MSADELFTQFGIAVFGLTALCFAMSLNPILRKWAPVLGLLGQPFWFIATIGSKQWGMVVLCVAYTLVYLNGLRIQWRKK